MTMSPRPSIEKGMGVTPRALGNMTLMGALSPLATETITSVPKTQKTSYTKRPASSVQPMAYEPSESISIP